MLRNQQKRDVKSHYETALSVLMMIGALGLCIFFLWQLHAYPLVAFAIEIVLGLSGFLVMKGEIRSVKMSTQSILSAIWLSSILAAVMTASSFSRNQAHLLKLFFGGRVTYTIDDSPYDANAEENTSGDRVYEWKGAGDKTLISVVEWGYIILTIGLPFATYLFFKREYDGPNGKPFSSSEADF